MIQSLNREMWMFYNFQEKSKKKEIIEKLNELIQLLKYEGIS